MTCARAARSGRGRGEAGPHLGKVRRLPRRQRDLKHVECVADRCVVADDRAELDDAKEKMMAVCPLCGSPAEMTDVVIESYDVDCPECKKFRITARALEFVQQNSDQVNS